MSLPCLNLSQPEISVTPRAVVCGCSRWWAEGAGGWGFCSVLMQAPGPFRARGAKPLQPIQPADLLDDRSASPDGQPGFASAARSGVSSSRVGAISVQFDVVQNNTDQLARPGGSPCRQL